ncbi:MAG: tRNA 2-thiouridine(34) synthase MnmA, partial [Lachnospiraceae bacterium]|nr:tRNA 2-thiouridine(34) synthase MnmA [Lachnospiraceae bacterium]
DCTVERVEEDLYKCVFFEKQRAVTPGQALVLYEDGMVAGGGTIL